MTWFYDLVGFSESAESVRNKLEVDGTSIRSKATGRVMDAGVLTTPSLAELRAQAEVTEIPAGSLTVTEQVADAGALHRDPANAGAFFQVASQFNLLEMVGPQVSPEVGITGYEHDRTQGPVCAIACGAGTLWRNWLVDIDGKTGQSRKSQLDMLADVGADLDNTRGQLWEMRNGYALATGDGLADLPDCHDALRIGLHSNTEVTTSAVGHSVTQAYCSALPVAYTGYATSATLEPLARLILNASYEATMAAAVLHFAAEGNPLIYLTMIGGGVFGNEPDWITDAMQRAFDLYSEARLDVRIVSYGRPNPDLIAVLTGDR